MKQNNILYKLISPSFWGLWNYKIANVLYFEKFKILYYFYFPFWRIISLITGIEIYGKTKIGKNLSIVHFGCIIINPDVIMGSDCLIYNNTTIGSAGYEGGAVPVLGNGVRIGVGARILGNIKIGNNVDIAANSVVVTSFPDNVVVAGCPAKIIKEKKII